MLPHSVCNLFRMKFAAPFLASILLALTSAHAESYGLKMLRNAAVNHDKERIHSLILREIRAEQSGDAVALKQAMTALSEASERQRGF